LNSLANLFDELDLEQIEMINNSLIKKDLERLDHVNEDNAKDKKENEKQSKLDEILKKLNPKL
jgi:hypothetical protein